MSMRAFRRNVERAVCDVVGIPVADLWSPKRRRIVRIARGLTVYTMTKAYPVAPADIAEAVGMAGPTLETARSEVARAAFTDPAIRRALWDIAGRVKLDPALLVPRPIEQVPV